MVRWQGRIRADGLHRQLARRVDHFLTTTQPWPGAKPSVATGPVDVKAA